MQNPDHASSTSEQTSSVEADRAALLDRCRNELEAVTDALALAAVFESWGITDSSAFRRYGATDVFRLADDMSTTLRADGTAAPRSAPSSAPSMRFDWLLRAGTYLPPTVFVVIALSNAAVPASGAAFALVTCLGWGIAEGVSRVSYTSINRGGVGAVRRTNQRLLARGTIVVLAVAATIGLASGSEVAALLICVQLQYLLLSIVLLPMERVAVLLWWITPAMLSVVLFVSSESHLWLVLLVAAIGEVAATAHGFFILHRITPSDYGAPTRREFWSASPFLASGVAMGAFVLTITAIALGSVGSRRVLLAIVVPLMLSMGLAEIGIRRFESDVVRLLEGSSRVKQFSRSVRWMVLRYCFVYLLVLAAIDVLIAAAWTDAPPASGIMSGYLLLGLVGLCLFLTLILRVMDHVLPVLAAFASGTVLMAALILLAGQSSGAVIAAAVSTTLAAAYLLITALRVVGHPADHAFV